MLLGGRIRSCGLFLAWFTSAGLAGDQRHLHMQFPRGASALHAPPPPRPRSSNPIGMLGFLEIHLNKGLCGFQYCDTVIYNRNSLWLLSRFLEQRSSHPWNFLNGEQHGSSPEPSELAPAFRLRPRERREGVASCQPPGCGPLSGSPRTRMWKDTF